MTAHRSTEEVNRLGTIAAKMRCAIMRATAGWEDYPVDRVGDWPEGREKRAMVRLRQAFRVETSAVSAETKYNALREAIEFAKSEIPGLEVN